MNCISQQQSGFSLVELLVSMTIFTMVLTISIGSLLVVIDANTKAQNMQEAMTNLNFALDSMTREIRTGNHYYCSTSATPPAEGSTNDCVSGRAIFYFTEGGESLTGPVSGNNRIGYRYRTVSGIGRLERRLGTGAWLPITSDEVNITHAEFVVNNTSTTDNNQPTVTIVIEGQAGDVPGLDSSFALQTTIAKRVIDL